MLGQKYKQTLIYIKKADMLPEGQRNIRRGTKIYCEGKISGNINRSVCVRTGSVATITMPQSQSGLDGTLPPPVTCRNI